MTDKQLLEWLYSDIDEAIDFEYKEKKDEQMPICCDDKIEQDIGREVLAWMPLPEPYKED